MLLGVGKREQQMSNLTVDGWVENSGLRNLKPKVVRVEREMSFRSTLDILVWAASISRPLSY